MVVIINSMRGRKCYMAFDYANVTTGKKHIDKKKLLPQNIQITRSLYLLILLDTIPNSILIIYLMMSTQFNFGILIYYYSFIALFVGEKCKRYSIILLCTRNVAEHGLSIEEIVMRWAAFLLLLILLLPINNCNISSYITRT